MSRISGAIGGRASVPYRTSPPHAQANARPRGYVQQRNSTSRTEHPIPLTASSPEDVGFASVAFRDSGYWNPDDPYVADWYRQISAPLSTLTPETVGGLTGRYLYPSHSIPPGTVLLTGNRIGYRLHLYLGLQTWYPLYEDHPPIERCSGRSRAAIARLIHVLHAVPPETLVLGCAMRAVADFLRANQPDINLREISYYRICEHYGHVTFLHDLRLALRGWPACSLATQIALIGPFSLAVLAMLENTEDYVEWSQLIAPAPAFNSEGILVDYTAALDDNENPDADLETDDSVLEVGHPPTFRRRIILPDDDKPNFDTLAD
jgi:hypothetical protein